VLGSIILSFSGQWEGGAMVVGRGFDSSMGGIIR
jgi:hypothetical protein